MALGPLDFHRPSKQVLEDIGDRIQPHHLLKLTRGEHADVARADRARCLLQVGKAEVEAHLRELDPTSIDRLLPHLDEIVAANASTAAADLRGPFMLVGVAGRADEVGAWSLALEPRGHGSFGVNTGAGRQHLATILDAAASAGLEVPRGVLVVQALLVYAPGRRFEVRLRGADFRSGKGESPALWSAGPSPELRLVDGRVRPPAEVVEHAHYAAIISPAEDASEVAVFASWDLGTNASRDELEPLTFAKPRAQRG